MIEPYYSESGITIYHADCRDVLPTLPSQSFDLCLTDPPYNVGKEYDGFADDLSANDYAVFMTQVARESRRVANHQAWVAPRYKLALFQSILDKSHLVVVRRGACGPFRGGWHDQFEIVLIEGKPNRPTPDLWDDIRLKAEGYFFREECYGHPGYTPALIMRRCASLLATRSLVDPFMGTGTSLRVAKDLGLRAVGIEQSERYCDIAARRLSQSVFDFSEAIP